MFEISLNSLSAWQFSLILATIYAIFTMAPAKPIPPATTTPSIPFTGATATDPYIYQTGFGNRFASEALTGVLIIGCNTTQRCKYDLISKQLNGTPFISPRASLLHT
jgi:homogentisate 1,2-dioxygenase